MASPTRRIPRHPAAHRRDHAPAQPTRAGPLGTENHPHANEHGPDGPLPPTCSPDATEVVKRLKPGQPGTRALQRRYGPALVCVRYRKDAGTGNTRFTTVELVIDHGPPRHQPLVRVAIRFDDTDTRRRAIELGAKWDSVQKTWRMPRRAAIQLGLITNKPRG